jgi:hypothetical protein
MATAGRRREPTFLILGAQKAGTSSLLEYLNWHPDVAPSELKEVDYFSFHYARGPRWYRSHFPPAAAGRQTGEASPSYLYDPRVPARVAAALPRVPLIALLRDPVERAISHYHHERKRDLEPLSLEEALDREEERIGAERDAVLAGTEERPVRMRHWSYADRGLYADQLERWFEHFPRERVLVLCAEQFFDQTAETYARVLDFLGLSAWAPEEFPVMNANPSAAPPPEVRARLEHRFAEPNERLFALLGERFPWEYASV